MITLLVLAVLLGYTSSESELSNRSRTILGSARFDIQFILNDNTFFRVVAPCQLVTFTNLICDKFLVPKYPGKRLILF